MIKWSQEPRGPREITFEEFYALANTFVGNGDYLGGWSPYIRGSIQRILPSLEGVRKYDYYTIVDTPNVVEYQMGEEIEFLKMDIIW